jgi:hypothetical protein
MIKKLSGGKSVNLTNVLTIAYSISESVGRYLMELTEKRYQMCAS